MAAAVDLDKRTGSGKRNEQQSSGAQHQAGDHTPTIAVPASLVSAALHAGR